MAFIVDSARFQAEGVYLQWAVIARRLGILRRASTAAPVLPNVLQLRWTLFHELGFPTEPFIVWRRHKSLREPKPINATTEPFPLLLAKMIDLKGSYSTIQITCTGSAGLVYAFAGGPMFGNIVHFSAIPAGTNVVVELNAPAMEGLIVSNGVNVTAIAGIKTDDHSAASGWEKFERVGIPVKESLWHGEGIGEHGTKQGMFGAFTSAENAAIERLTRGSPPFGWAPVIQTGFNAPLWAPPAFPPLIGDLNHMVLDDLRSIANLPPNVHHSTKVSKTVPPPENSSGDQMSEPDGTSEVAPLTMTYMASSTDCFNALALGFGTAYPVVKVNLGAASLSALDYDYMITARWEKGIDGSGAPAEYAAIVPTPSPGIPPPAPANMALQQMGNLRPMATDRPWRASVRTSWDKPVPIPLFRPRSYAFVRAGTAPVTPPVLLMNKRSDGTPLPIAVNYYTNEQDPEPNRTSAVEREIPIPNDPGTFSLRYAVAHQDIYGQWSKWSAASTTAAQPDVDQVRIVSAQFKYISVPTPPAGMCSANLELEFLWDWRVRTPKRISFRGRLYSASFHGEPPPNTTLPAGLQKSLGGPLTDTFTLQFDVLAANGAPTSSWPGYNPLTHCRALNPAGDQSVAFGGAQGPETRRYRVIIPGFQLNFAGTGHIGLALWGQGQEALAPQHIGNWSNEPSVIATSDPRPPLIIPEIVALSSLPDSAGESHAVLKWAASPGADGYFIYESNESKLLKSAGEPEPDAADTLSDRLVKLLDIFEADPIKRRSDFTRRNAQLLKATSADVTLPRGTTSIHLYIVLGVSAGQIEANWPTARTAVYAFAVPRVPKPGVPMIEVSSQLDETVMPPVYRARIRVETRKGPRVRRIDLHRVRVDDAAKLLETMGPPVTTLDALTPGWHIDEVTDSLGSHITAATGVDTPTGSWKRVWYRAAAWSNSDGPRGVLAARSAGSTTAWTVIPPNQPPNLSPITMEWPGTDPEDVLLKWTSAAPLKKTPLGPHRMSITARRAGAPTEEEPLIAFEGELLDSAVSQPGAGSGAWREPDTKPAQYRAIIRRNDINDGVEVSVRITDPIGRSSESLASIGPGHILPDPVLTDFLLQQSVAPPGVTLNWASTTPLDPAVYTLMVTVMRPPIKIFNIAIPLPPIVQQMALSDVPLDEPGPVPSGADPLRIRRFSGSGPNYNYYAFVRVPFTQIIVRLTSPDGRIAQHAQLP